MVNTGSAIHKQSISRIIAELEREGYRVIDLKGKCPDAIAINGKDDVIAIESLLGSGDITYSERAERKVKDYINLGFDDVFVFAFSKDGRLLFNTSDWLVSCTSGNGALCEKVMVGLSGAKFEDIRSEMF